MLTAPILTVLTSVHVNRDLLEMVQFVKVCECEKISTASSSSTVHDYITCCTQLNDSFISIDIVSFDHNIRRPFLVNSSSINHPDSVLNQLNPFYWFHVKKSHLHSYHSRSEGSLNSFDCTLYTFLTL